jgi:hypothetical protein
MNPATITDASFVVKGPGGPVVGTLTYDAATMTARFTPDQPLAANTTFTVELTQAITDLDGKPLRQGISVGNIRDTWTFTTVAPTVQFSNVSYTVNENETATVTVTLNVPSTTPVMVDFATQDGTAVAGVDYETSSGTLTFNPGSASELLSNPSGATEGVPFSATLTIFDDESPPVVRFDLSDYTVNEGDGTALIGISLFPPSSTEVVTVNFNTSDGTAIAGVDYTAVSETVTFSPGETTKSVAVPILENSINELDKTVNLTLSNATPVDVVIENGAATLTIQDNDPLPSVQFEFADYEVDEGAGKVTLNVTLTPASGRSVTVKYATGGGTAVPGVDYEAAAGILEFTVGQTTQSIEITILDDNLQDAGETFNVTLSEPNGANLGTPTSATVTITGQDVYKLFLPAVLAAE